MFKNRKVDDIKNLFATSLEKNQAVFMYLEYSGVIVRTSNRTILVDPANLLNEVEIKAMKRVDLLLFTHSHGDHYSSKDTLDIFKVADSPIIAETLVADDLVGKIPSDKLTDAKPGKTYTFSDITVRVVSGIHGCPINLYHLQIGDIGIFHAGDSGYVPVKDYPADLAFLPTGILRPFIPSSSPENAFKLASELKPSVAVAIHGSAGHSEEFKSKVEEELPNTTVIIPESYLPKKVSLQIT